MKNKPNEYAYEASGSRHSRFTSGRKADPQRRLAKAVIPLLLLVCILLSVTFLSFGGSLAGVNAGAEENGNVSGTDLHSETASLPDDTTASDVLNISPPSIHSRSRSTGARPTAARAPSAFPAIGTRRRARPACPVATVPPTPGSQASKSATTGSLAIPSATTPASRPRRSFCRRTSGSARFPLATTS